MKFFGSKDIKARVRSFILDEQSSFKNKVVLDLPAGTGETSDLLQKVGADVRPFDLFPNFFNSSNNDLKCGFCDLSLQKINIEKHSCDAIFCQEGIEHISDQLQLLKNFNTILVPNGKLYVTTPNLSNLRAKFSYLVHESELFFKILPPNEVDSVWFSENNTLYFGHIFLIGVQKLRVLSKLSGFRIKRVISTRVNYTSFILFVFFFPFIFIISLFGYLRALKKMKKNEHAQTYKEVFLNNINLNILLGNHIFLELEKEFEHDQVPSNLKLADGKVILKT